MPGMGGVKATAELLRAHPQVKVVGFTAWAESDGPALLSAGAVTVIEKTNIAGLLAALRDVTADR